MRRGKELKSMRIHLTERKWFFATLAVALAIMGMFVFGGVKEASAQVHVFGINLQKSCPVSVTPGEEVTCTITIENNDVDHGVNLQMIEDIFPFPGGDDIYSGGCATTLTASDGVTGSGTDFTSCDEVFTIPLDAPCGETLENQVTVSFQDAIFTTLRDTNQASGLMSVVCADLLLEKVDTEGAPQAGVLLEITGPGEATTTFSCTTEEDGTCTITGLVPGSYTVTEPDPPEGYALVGCEPSTIEVTVQGPNVVTCTNELETGDLLLEKVDTKGAPQAGVLLEITGPGEDTTTFSCTTEEDGTCTITGLVPGSYTVTEPDPPEGYALVGCEPSTIEVTVQGPNVVTCTNEAVMLEGCTPGYWKQPHHFDSWVGYQPTDSFEDIFGVDVTLRAGGRNTINDPTLLDALNATGGGVNALARHAVAALLNASNPDVAYEYTEAEIIQMVQDAIESGDYETVKNLLETANERGCPLN